MKKVYVIYNRVTGVFGMPFVSDDVNTALSSVCGVISSKDWSTTLACSFLYEIGSYDDKFGQLFKTKKKIVADATDLMAVAVDYSDNVLETLDHSIDILQQLRSFYNGNKEEIKSDDEACTEEV